MPEHIHMEIRKRREHGEEVTRFVVLRRFETQESQVAGEMGYSVDGRYCGDPRCLGPEPFGRLDDLKA